ncbi:MAG: hypothetical protein GY715_04030 [Planctomycetes bacterium]|nr:hypothetical protein [Planctomycetota bacterium]
MLPLPSEAHREPAECVIRVGAGGEEIAEFYPYLTEVTVECSREKSSVATLAFESIRNEQGEWNVQDAEVFEPWTPIAIEAAFGAYTEEVMRGYVREIKVDYPDDTAISTVRVQCQDDSLALDRDHVRTTWGADAPTTDGVIVRSIVSRYALLLHPESGEGLGNLVLNQDKTDIRFLKDRADANGYELIFREGGVYFGPWRVDAEAQATIFVYAGRDTNCISFDVAADGHLPDKVALDMAEEQGSGTVERIVESDLRLLGSARAESSRAGLDDFVWRMSRQGGATEEEMIARATRKANELAMKVKAEGELDGSRYGHVLRVGEPVPVDGVGTWLGGRYYVDTVKHTFDPDGYREAFTLLRNAYGDDLGGAAANVLSGVI